MPRLRLISRDGTLTEPSEVPKLELSDNEWRKRLTPEQFRIVRSSGTERPFCGGLLENKESGLYLCVGCGLPLFKSDAKFESGTGWPSFFQPVAKENVAEKVDSSHGMRRVEINCGRCDGHLGHVFEDGPRPTGLRYCLNSDALRFVKDADLKKEADAATS
jgi:methionine-R-sulfoxide reductase